MWYGMADGEGVGAGVGAFGLVVTVSMMTVPTRHYDDGEIINVCILT